MTDSRRVRVLLVARELPPVIGGVERQMDLLARALRDDGMKVEAWATNADAGVAPHVSLHLRPRWCSWMPLYLAWLSVSLAWKRVRHWREAVVAVVARVSAESAAVAVVGGLLRLPVIIFLTGGDARGSELLWQRRAWVRRLLTRRAAGFVAHAEVFLDEVRRLGSPARLVCIPTIVPVDGGPPCRDVDAFPRGSLALVWCGRDDPVKNIAALGRMAEGPLLDETSSLLVIIDRPPVVVVPNASLHVGCASVRSHLARSDVLVLTSLFEGQSNAMAEAAIEGTPTVAYATGGTPKALQRLDCGQTVAVGVSDEEFAAAVRRVARRFSDESERQALRQRARQTFSADAVTSWVTLVRDVARRRCASG